MPRLTPEITLEDEELHSSEEINEAESLRRFQTSLSRFSFAGAGSASKPQSPTKTLPVPEPSKALLTSPMRGTKTVSSPSVASGSSKRVRPEGTESEETSPSKKPKGKGKKAARGYASPEVYAHLNPVNDNLSESLDSKFSCF